MPPISHKYLLKLRREVGVFEEWLGNTKPEPDGSASAADLQAIFTRANSLYLKALALYRTTGEEGDNPEDSEAGEAIISGG